MDKFPVVQPRCRYCDEFGQHATVDECLVALRAAHAMLTQVRTLSPEPHAVTVQRIPPGVSGWR